MQPERVGILTIEGLTFLGTRLKIVERRPHLLNRTERDVLARLYMETLGDEFKAYSDSDKAALGGYALSRWYHPDPTFAKRGIVHVLETDNEPVGVFDVYWGSKWNRSHCFSSSEVNADYLRCLAYLAKRTNGNVPAVLSTSQFSKEDLSYFASLNDMVLHRDKEHPNINSVTMIRIANNKRDFQKALTKIDLKDLPDSLSSRDPLRLNQREHADMLFKLLNEASPYHSFHVEDFDEENVVRWGYFDDDGNLICTISCRLPVETPYGQIAIISELATDENWRKKGIGVHARIHNLKFLFDTHPDAIAIADVEQPQNSNRTYTSNIGYHAIHMSHWFVLEPKRFANDEIPVEIV